MAMSAYGEALQRMRSEWVVFDPGRCHFGAWLIVEGPFQYPRWTENRDLASRFTRSLAHQFGCALKASPYCVG